MNRKQCVRSRMLGVTLIELLIVISIISLLVSLLFVIGGAVREKARELKCRSHMGRLGLILTRYAQDHHGRFPSVRGSDESWIPAILPYVDSKSILVCPSDWKLASSPDGRVEEEEHAHRTTSYDYLPRYRIEVSPDIYIYYSIRWIDVFKKRGDATPILRCPYHGDRDLFLRVNGYIGSTRQGSDWTQW